MTDPNRGLGGSYIIDPSTGERKLEERTEPQQEAPPAETTETEAPAIPAGKAKRGK